jgi:hypothetical protein
MVDWSDDEDDDSYVEDDNPLGYSNVATESGSAVEEEKEGSSV